VSKIREACAAEHLAVRAMSFDAFTCSVREGRSGLVANSRKRLKIAGNPVAQFS